jgi:hypothetical protein
MQAVQKYYYPHSFFICLPFNQFIIFNFPPKKYGWCWKTQIMHLCGCGMDPSVLYYTPKTCIITGPNVLFGYQRDVFGDPLSLFNIFFPPHYYYYYYYYIRIWFFNYLKFVLHPMYHVHAMYMPCTCHLTAFGWRLLLWALLLHQHIQIPQCPQSASQLQFTHGHNFTYLF